MGARTGCQEALVGAFLPLGSMVSQTHLPHDGMFLSQGGDRLRVAAPVWRPSQ